MFYSTKLFLALMVCILGLGLGAAAQETLPAEIPPEVTEMVALDEDIRPEDLGIAEPRILPDSPFYFTKGITRGIQSFFTFDPIKKIELKLRFSNEKIMEAKKLAELHPQEPKILGRAFEVYKTEMNQLEKAAEKVKETIEEPEVDEFMDKFIDNNLKHQKLFGKFEKDLPPDVFEKIEEAKEANLARFAEIPSRLASPEAFQEKIVEAIKEMPGSDFRHFKNLEVLRTVEERVPEPAKPAIRRAMDNTLNRFREDMEKMTQERRVMLPEYARYIGGNEARHLAIVDDFEKEELPRIVREEMEKAKERILERTGERLKEYEEKELTGARDKFLGHLTEYGRMEDLRIIKEMENNLSPEVINQILAIKKGSERRIIEVMERAETPEQQKEFFEKIDEKFHDVQQFEVFKEIEDIIPPEKKEFFEKMKEMAMARMKEEFERGRRMGQEEAGMIFDKLAGDSPEHIMIFKEFGPDSPEIMREIMGKTIESLQRRTESIQDPAKLEVLKRRIEEEEMIRREIEAKNPQMFGRLEEKSEMFMKTLDAEKAREQIEWARKEISIAEQKLSFLDPELQKEVLEKGPYSSLLTKAKHHLEKAERNLAEEFYGETFGQANAALHNATDALRTIDDFQTERFFGEEREGKLKERFPELWFPEEEKCPQFEPPRLDFCRGGQVLFETDPSGCPKPPRCILPEPELCPPKKEPVCGMFEDGRTKIFENPCVAESMGAKILYSGECRVELPPAEIPVVSVCPEYWQPVCGFDNQTYSNKCEARSQGIGIAYEGECHEKETCPMIFNPVCGADDVTYDNDCLARLKGVEIKYWGRCEADPRPTCEAVCKAVGTKSEGWYDSCTGMLIKWETCGLPEEKPCPEVMVPSCEGGKSTSGGVDERGCPLPPKCEITTTRPEPGVCLEIWEPVCGVDGETYASECKAKSFGAEIHYKGECKREIIPPPDQTITPTPTPEPMPEPVFCIQVITPAKDPRTGECKEFPTPCDVPEGWEKLDRCPTLFEEKLIKPIEETFIEPIKEMLPPQTTQPIEEKTIKEEPVIKEEPMERIEIKPIEIKE